MAHYVDARKDEADGSFLPPIRSIGFNPKVTVNDSILAQSYVDSYDISYPEACKRVDEDVEKLKERISTDGYYEFNGIGTVRVNAEGNYEFTPCKAGILTPELYGLDSFGMKTLDELRGMAAKPWTVVNTERQVADADSADVNDIDDYDKEAYTARDSPLAQCSRSVHCRNTVLAHSISTCQQRANGRQQHRLPFAQSCHATRDDHGKAKCGERNKKLLTSS